MKIKTIVITGGPCAGKTSALNKIRQDISLLGYRVLCIPETATEFITGGVAPWTCGTNYEFQTVQMTLQKKKEELYYQAAKSMESQSDKILIVCDRGLFDNMAYIDKAGFLDILDKMGLSRETVFAGYDGIFHLETAAIGSDAFSTDLNNAIRYEDDVQACQLDAKFILAWAGHPQHYRIHSCEEFDRKMKVLTNGIAKLIEDKILYEDVEMPEHLQQVPEDDVPWEYSAIFPES